MVVFRDMWCVYKRNVQHHIDPIVLKAATYRRKEIWVFHIREQLRLRQVRTFETKTPGLVSIQTVWHLNIVIVEILF